MANGLYLALRLKVRLGASGHCGSALAQLAHRRIGEAQVMKKITIAENGPYLVDGGVSLANQHIVTNEQGESLEWRDGDAFPLSNKYALCRCGSSRTKPF